jgi:hypothetical protein
MACFHPLDAWQLDSGEIVFVERGAIRRPLLLPCGRCIGCRLVRVRSWAIRCMHESQMHDVSSFVTLTFDEAHYRPSLDYVDFQRFMYRLRKRFGPTRFFVCGEYGDENFRPHYHCLLFGRTFSDASACGSNIYRSPHLEALWPFGFSSFGSVTYESAAYVAGYACKRISGPPAKRHYERVDISTGEIIDVVPEFGHMSLKPGIGYTGGESVPPPRYYDKLLMSMDSDFMEWRQFERYLRSDKFKDDCTVDRLLVREQCAIAKRNFNRRSKI